MVFNFGIKTENSIIACKILNGLYIKAGDGSLVFLYHKYDICSMATKS